MKNTKQMHEMLLKLFDIITYIFSFHIMIMRKYSVLYRFQLFMLFKLVVFDHNIGIKQNIIFTKYLLYWKNL